jgi:hypothetical protein
MRLCADIETNGLLPTVDTIHCIVAIDLDTKERITFRPNEVEDGVGYLSEASLLVGHNWAGYDAPVIKHITGVDLSHIPTVDTQAVSRALFTATLRDADYKRMASGFPKALIGRHSLESWGWRLGDRKGEFGCGGKTDWSVFTEEMLSYCQQDVVVNVKLYEFFRDFERVPGIPAMPLAAMLNESAVHGILGEQERNGVAFDSDSAVGLVAGLQTDKAKAIARLQDIFPAEYISRGAFTPKRANKTLGYVKGGEMTKIELQEFNPGSDIQVGDRLKRMGWQPVDFTPGGQPKVDETTLSGLHEEDYPGVTDMLQYKIIDKRLGQLYEGKGAWLKKVTDSGRLHGRVMSTGTRTGRMSHSAPNLAQVPRVGSYLGEECRALFGPQETGFLVGCDASGLELRTLANRMAPFDGGAFARLVVEGDVHEVMRQASGLHDRNHQKTFTYAMLYGAGATKLGQTVAADLRDAGLPITAPERTLGRRTHGRLVSSLKGLGPLLKAAKAAHKRGFIKLLNGLYVKSASEHSALNTLLQGDGAVVMKEAQMLLATWIRQAGLDCQWNLTVHDEFQLETKTEEDARAVGSLARTSIREAGRRLGMKVELDAEYKIGRNWKETH